MKFSIKKLFWNFEAFAFKHTFKWSYLIRPFLLLAIVILIILSNFGPLRKRFTREGIISLKHKTNWSSQGRNFSGNFRNWMTHVKENHATRMTIRMTTERPLNYVRVLNNQGKKTMSREAPPETMTLSWKSHAGTHTMVSWAVDPNLKKKALTLTKWRKVQDLGELLWSKESVIHGNGECNRLM